MTALTRAFEKFRSSGYSLRELLNAAKEDGVLTETHEHLCPACQEFFGCAELDCINHDEIYHRECYRQAEEASQ